MNEIIHRGLDIGAIGYIFSNNYAEIQKKCIFAPLKGYQSIHEGTIIVLFFISWSYAKGKSGYTFEGSPRHGRIVISNRFFDFDR